MNARLIATMTLIGVAAWLLAGCGGNPVTPPAKDAPAAPSGAKASTTDTADTTKPAPLTEADRQLIAKQQTCPVTGEKLGSMGEPYKVVVKGRVVFLCCEGCKEEIEAHPDKYLAKLK
jgi:YHS domain-containing protein